jgi:hypothetical protein
VIILKIEETLVLDYITEKLQQKDGNKYTERKVVLKGDGISLTFKDKKSDHPLKQFGQKDIGEKAHFSLDIEEKQKSIHDFEDQ